MHELTAKIDALLSQKEQVIVAIDGNCAAGKSTLADKLQEKYGCTLIHIDDFFLRPEQRTEARFAEIGGNVDYERFHEEVLAPLQSGQSFSYQPFDCSSFTLSPAVPVTPGKLTIIEGSYSHHPYFGDTYDLRLFLTVAPEVQRQRILQRPAFLHQRFFTEWIPMEHRYFDSFHIREKADLVMDTLTEK